MEVAWTGCPSGVKPPRYCEMHAFLDCWYCFGNPKHYLIHRSGGVIEIPNVEGNNEPTAGTSKDNEHDFEVIEEGNDADPVFEIIWENFIMDQDAKEASVKGLKHLNESKFFLRHEFPLSNIYTAFSCNNCQLLSPKDKPKFCKNGHVFCQRCYVSYKEECAVCGAFLVGESEPLSAMADATLSAVTASSRIPVWLLKPVLSCVKCFKCPATPPIICSSGHYTCGSCLSKELDPRCVQCKSNIVGINKVLKKALKSELEKFELTDGIWPLRKSRSESSVLQPFVCDLGKLMKYSEKDCDPEVLDEDRFVKWKPQPEIQEAPIIQPSVFRSEASVRLPVLANLKNLYKKRNEDKRIFFSWKVEPERPRPLPRFVVCPRLGCDSQFTRNNILYHFETHHSWLQLIEVEDIKERVSFTLDIEELRNPRLEKVDVLFLFAVSTMPVEILRKKWGNEKDFIQIARLGPESDIGVFVFSVAQVPARNGPLVMFWMSHIGSSRLYWVMKHGDLTKADLPIPLSRDKQAVDQVLASGQCLTIPMKFLMPKGKFSFEIGFESVLDPKEWY